MAVVAATPASADAEDNQWHASANIYAWVSDTDIGVRIPTGTETISINALDAFRHVELAIMGGGTVSRGRVGLAADLLYARLNASDQIDSAARALQVDLGFRARTLVFTVAPFYTVIDNQRFKLRTLVGGRYLDLDQRVDFTVSSPTTIPPIPPISGSAAAKVANWDGVAGLSAEWRPRQRGLFVPVAIDVGTGDSMLTWQYVAGVGYRFGRGDITLAYRDLRYKLSGEVAQLRLHGPAIGAAVQF